MILIGSDFWPTLYNNFSPKTFQTYSCVFLRILISGKIFFLVNVFYLQMCSSLYHKLSPHSFYPTRVSYPRDAQYSVRPNNYIINLKSDNSFFSVD